MTGPLAGVRVVDAAAGIAGGYAAKLLADAGADVLRVESVEPGLLQSHLHAAKRRGSLPDEADVLIRGSDTAPATRVSAGLHDRYPVIVTLSPFGAGGPWSERAANEFTLQAWCGSMSMRHAPGRPPVMAGGSPGLWAAGAMAALGAAAFLGRGVELDVSIFETMTAIWGTPSLEAQLLPGQGPPPRAPEVPSIEQAADGMVGFGIVTATQWRDFCVLVEKPEWRDDPRLATMAGRYQHIEEVRAGIAAWLLERPVAEIVERASLLRIPVVPVGNGASVTGIEPYRAGETFRRHVSGEFREPRSPLRFGAAGIPGRPLASDATDPPLSGVRVADFTAFWAGPYATQLLALLGADVIHVESTRHPDGMRLRSVHTPGDGEWWEWSPIFHAVNASKRGLTLDLDHPRGLEAAQRLIARSDVVVENFSPRVMDGWGLDGAGVRQIQPRAVMLRMPAFGLDGPWRDRTGFQMTMEQMSGIAWITGWPDDRPWVPYVCDPVAGIHAAFAAVCGLEHRRRSGEGQQIEVRMSEVAAAIAAEQLVEFSGAGRLLTRAGNRAADGTRQGVYACRDGNWLAISAPEEDLARVLGDGASDPGSFCAAHDVGDALGRLWDAGIPAARVESGRGAHLNPQHLGRGFHSRCEHRWVGPVLVPGLPLRVTGAPRLDPRSAAPTLGQHSDEVLRELGLADAEVSGLREEGVTGEQLAGSRLM